MKNNFLNKSVANVYIKPTSNSEVVSQILYGEKFKILLKRKKYLKIKTHYDNYIGYIKKDKFLENFKPSHKVSKIKSRIFFKKGKRFLSSNHYLYYGSGVCIRNENKKYIEFKKNKWIKKSDIKNIDHYEKNYIKVFKFFLNTKYLWGGKTCAGIDCSALIQIYFYYNRIFFPRDTKDQIRFCKRKRGKNRLKGDILFWKGHVGICLNKLRFIHAYGPKKKVIIMPTIQTIKLIDKTANLKVKKVSNICNI
ncbi:C40 family peptidase [Candidatus Pelagibacter sp.]|uniref:C40 family peptidase n=1 Tax=Candidatus Pelagibacter sp. TaxID=2024849 RepID=UPI003F84E68F